MTIDRPFAALLLLLGLAGCFRVPMDRDYAGPAPKPDWFLERFALDGPSPAPTVVEREGTTKRYTVRRLTMPAVRTLAEPHDITIDEFMPTRPGPRPAVLVLPILGGDNEVAEHFSKYFAKRGFAAYIVHRQDSYKDQDELEDLNPTFGQIVLDHRQALDWIESQPEVSPSQIGVFGISAGAIKASLVWAADDRPVAAVLALVGGDVPYIFAYSKERGIEKQRNKIFEKHGGNQDELFKVLDDEFIHDPLDYASYMDASNTLMILAVFDQSVPYQTGKALREAMGSPETIYLPTGHYGAILYLPFAQSAAYGYFRRKFRVGEERN